MQILAFQHLLSLYISNRHFTTFTIIIITHILCALMFSSRNNVACHSARIVNDARCVVRCRALIHRAATLHGNAAPKHYTSQFRLIGVLVFSLQPAAHSLAQSFCFVVVIIILFVPFLFQVSISFAAFVAFVFVQLFYFIACFRRVSGVALQCVVIWATRWQLQPRRWQQRCVAMIVATCLRLYVALAPVSSAAVPVAIAVWYHFLRRLLRIAA